jgi:RimJ/RimL family protein N-acetyltransferase
MEIITERLRLREFVIDDWQAVQAYHTDPLYQRYYPERSLSDATERAFVLSFIEQQDTQPRINYQFAIELPENGNLIGNAGIRLRSLGKREPDAYQADIGYELDPGYWGKGYASEAVRAVIKFGFATLRVHRIWAYCLAENRASAHVLEKVGMRLEGHLREDEYFKGRWWDTLIYGMLEEEWKPES